MLTTIVFTMSRRESDVVWWWETKDYCESVSVRFPVKLSSLFPFQLTSCWVTLTSAKFMNILWSPLPMNDWVSQQAFMENSRMLHIENKVLETFKKLTGFKLFQWWNPQEALFWHSCYFCIQFSFHLGIIYEASTERFSLDFDASSVLTTIVRETGSKENLIIGDYCNRIIGN